MKCKAGFSLLEVMLSTALLAVVGSMGLMVVLSASRSVNLDQTVAYLQQEARGVLLHLSREIESAVKPAKTGFSLPPGVQGLRVIEEGSAITFQVPTNPGFTTFSAPITIRFESEDTPLAINADFEFGNAFLDWGEDLNGDGVLTRRIVRHQSGETRVIGGANNIAFAEFEFNEDNDLLRVRLVLTRRIEPLKPWLARYEVQEEIYLMN